jgi:integrase
MLKNTYRQLLMELDTSLWTAAETLYFPRRIKIRSQQTRRQYRYAIEDFAQFLGRPATLLDLDDDMVTAWLGHLLDRDKSAWTTREKLGRVLALWRWLAARRVVDKWPTVERPDAPETMPVALSREQLRALFAACEVMGGHVDGIPSCRWWRSLLAFVWNTSERRGACLAVRCDWVDWERGVVSIPAQVRKGKRKSATYALWPETLSLLQSIRLPERELVWPWDKSDAAYWYQFGRLLKLAGVPCDRKHKTHSLRVSHNTWTMKLTGHHSPLLQHTDPSTSDKHYTDKRLTQTEPPSLFIPWAG